MISYLDALEKIREAATLQPSETVDLMTLACRPGLIVAAEDCQARIDVPSFHNSAMDGFAVQSSTTQMASPEQPCVLSVGACLAAGDSPNHSQNPCSGSALPSVDNQAVEIMTGAPVPDGFDAVVMVEKSNPTLDAQGKTLSIRLETPLEAGENLRFRGEDFQAGQPIVRQGERLTARQLAALAATGTAQIQVRALPAFALFATGKEISDQYGHPLGDSEIYNSNIPYLCSQLSSAGFPNRYVGNIGDDPEQFSRWLDALTDARILISSGAVSKGRWDFIPDVLAQKGARILFHGVAIKPGKPVLFAVLPDGRYFFGLPGNPIATAVGLRFFVQPLLRALLGMPPEEHPVLCLNRDYQKKGPLRHFLKSSLAYSEDGQLRLTVLNGQESFRISPLLDTQAWAIVEEDRNTLSAGERVHLASADLFSPL